MNQRTCPRPWTGLPSRPNWTRLDTLLAGREIGLFHLVCYLRDGDRVFETYWTTRRGAEAMDNNYALMDLTVHGRQEPWEDSPPGWRLTAAGNGPAATFGPAAAYGSTGPPPTRSGSWPRTASRTTAYPCGSADSRG